VRGMRGGVRIACLAELRCARCAVMTHCCAQVELVFPKLWTFSMRQANLLHSQRLHYYLYHQRLQPLYHHLTPVCFLRRLRLIRHPLQLHLP
jgi:hypothetical protein